MILKLKSNKIIRRIILINLAVLTFSLLVIYCLDIFWNTGDYKLIDRLYSNAVANGKGPLISNRISMVNIDDRTYDYFASSTLNRDDLAKLNNLLGRLDPEAVLYDIVFRSPSSSSSDSLFVQSAKSLNKLYLPVGFYLEKDKEKFAWGNGEFYNRLRSNYLKRLKESGSGKPFYAKWPLTQNEKFTPISFNCGHINVNADNDGTFRHYPLIIKVDSLFFPSISLAMFLDYNHIPFEHIRVNWGNSIIIPAEKGSFLDKDINIPIDEKGNTFISYPQFWRNIPRKLTAQQLINYIKDDKYFTKLLEYIEGNFVFVADISTGISDIGQTPLEENVPKVLMHTAVLNSLLTDSFYSEWNRQNCFLLLFTLGLFIIISTVPKSNIFFYSAGIVLISGPIYFTYYELDHFRLFPGLTFLVFTILFFLSVLITLHVNISREQKFIRSAFSKYLPDNVIERISENPELLRLGGEERLLTIMFIDIAGFTSIAERLRPEEMVGFLNKYFSEITDIIIQNGGIVDKYIGDGILAEFGAPLSLPDHPKAAVLSALSIQEKFKELNNKSSVSNIGPVKCRIGINTGKAIIGNMGSEKVFDYTAIGDSVNLAARLESANKIFGTSILISESTYNSLPQEYFDIRPLDKITVKGISRPVQVYEVCAIKEMI